MSLFNAMRALKILGNMETHKEVVIKTPLTTTIEGPANGVSEIPKPHGIPMSMELYEPDDLTEVGGRWGELDEGDLAVDVIEFVKKPKSWKSKLPESDKALLGISNLLFMKDKKEKPSEHAGPVTGDPSKRDLFNNEWQNTEVNLNHLDLEADRNPINSLKAAYINQCKFFDHEICSINLRKAILYQSKSLVKIIIRSHRIDFLKNPKALPTNQDKSSIVNMMDAFRVTPLMIAAQVGNYKIVKVLLQYGADPTTVTSAGDTALSIGARHHDERMIKLLIDYGADIGVALCMVGLNRPSLYHKARFEDMLNAPTIGLSHYGFSFEPILILSQPKFLLRARNPIYEAFKVGTIINKIGDKKDEYLGDCEVLESQTDDFAYYYLDQCRTMWEALLLLNDQQINDANIDLLQYAMKRKKMKFISHHFCQQYIMDTWYGGVQRGRTKNTLKKLGHLFMYHLFMPFILIYAFFSLLQGFKLIEYNGINNTRLMTIWNNLHVPVVSYIVDLFNFFVLCTVMTWTCLTITESYADTSWAEIVLWMCLAARFMVEMDKIRTQGKEFFKHAGNVVDLSVSCSIIFTVLLRLVAYGNIYDSAKFPLWSSYVYATAFLGLMLRMLEMLDITYTLGPLEGAIGKMMMDVIKVCLLLILCIVGFSVSMWTITLQSYHYEVEANKNRIASAAKNSTITPKAIAFPELFSSFNTTLVSLLWSTFGLIEPENIGISYNNNADSYLKLLWGIYILTAMILFLNMLIAMLTETYVKVINNAEIEWKYARSVVVKKYVGTHPFMFPFNLILYPLFLLYHIGVERRMNKMEVKETNEADIEAMRQSGFLHQAIKKRFKSKFSDVLNIPYYHRTNIFDYYTTFPFQNKGTTHVHKRRMSTFRAPKRDSESSSSGGGGSYQSGESDEQ